MKDSVADIVISMFVFFSETRRLIFYSLSSLGEILSLHQGLGLDIWWREHLSCPSEEDYIDMAIKSRSGSWSCFHQSSLTSLGKAF